MKVIIIMNLTKNRVSRAFCKIIQKLHAGHLLCDRRATKFNYIGKLFK